MCKILLSKLASKKEQVDDKTDACLSRRRATEGTRSTAEIETKRKHEAQRSACRKDMLQGAGRGPTANGTAGAEPRIAPPRPAPEEGRKENGSGAQEADYARGIAAAEEHFEELRGI